MPKKRRVGRPPKQDARYKAIAAELTQRIESGEWPAGKPLPSCRALARTYRVGVKTIWRALKILSSDGRARVTPRRKSVIVRRAPLSEVLDKAIALVTKTEVVDFVAMPLGQGILKALSKPRTPFVYLHERRWWRDDAPDGLRELPLKGILLQSPLPAELLKKYETMGVPAVLMDEPGTTYALHTVSVDNHESAFDAVSRLIALGHKRIAFVRSLVESINDIDPDSRERQAGFVAACERAGFNSEQYAIFSVNFDWRSVSIRRLLDAKPRFTAVLCAADQHARQLHAVAARAGIRIPEDLSIATFREVQPYPVDWSGPMIDFEEMGRVAAELLQRNPKAIQNIRLATKWNAGATIDKPARSRS
jgi:DNA-binding transcriptional regulator YhcF (GntR family)